jgi:acetyl-CoA carboxylase biotin carboxylase subunit
MIRRLLIANRGEIALRIVRACREMNVESVAVYSEIDRTAPHVTAADRSVAIGPAAPAESYLATTKLIEAARETGADAIHPGYGFLSERAAFARACEQAGLIFVGPPSDVLARMGSKIEARRLMQSIGVPVVPGETTEDQSDDGVRRAVLRVGLPALIKASAGGGGTGMRRVRAPDEILDAVDSARREATAAFGDGTLYVERLIERPKHIEVQVFGDRDGGIVHLFERECSVQRRHQKIIEESPSPSLTPGLRSRMTEAAVAAATAAAYRNAGTVEFLLDGSGDAARFYFLEMNARLQVEHPVTECVVGVDLVRAQLIVAAGERLPWTADSLSQRGHAVEARVYAEDPTKDFLPQAGRLLLYREPRIPGVRIDSGVTEGSDVSVYYDSLLAKVIAAAETRAAAIIRLRAALRDFPILGIQTNIPLLLRVLDDARFRSGNVDTSFLDAAGDAFVRPTPQDVPPHVTAALAAHAESPECLGSSGSPIRAPQASLHDPWQTLRGWR